FALCGLIAPAILFSVPYCEDCQVYMKTKPLGLLPAGIVPRNVKKKDVEGQQAYAAEAQAAAEAGMLEMGRLLQAVNEKAAQQFVQIRRRHASNQKAIAKQTSRIVVSLEHCRQCRAGRVGLKLQSGQGEQVATTDLGRTEVDPVFTENVMHFD